MRFITIFILLACSNHLSSQYFGGNFNLETVPCPYDTSIQVSQPIHWEVYQTIDDRWDGVRDSTQCFTFEVINSVYASLDLSQIDAEKPLFCRYVFPDEIHELPSNTVYSTIGNVYSEATLNILDTCHNDLCSGYFIHYSIPNESGDGRTTRVVMDNFHDTANNSTETCWVTDNLDSIFVQAMVMKFTFSEDNLNNQQLRLRGLGSNVQEFADAVSSFLFPAYLQQDTAYVGDFYQAVLESGDSYSYQPLFVRQTGGYPSFDHYTYIEAYPDFFTDEQQTFVLQYFFGGGLLFQPFTGIRGSLVDGSDSLRHRLILDFDEDYHSCQNLFLDLIIPTNTTYRFASGSIEFAHARSCYMLMDGGSLEIKASGKFQYGANGIGVLALAREGHVYLNENSELIIGNKVLLNAFSGGASEQAYIHLAEGSHLSFDQYASLKRNFGNNMYLNIYMNGGTVDVAELSAEEQSLIRYIYPETPPISIEIMEPGEVRILPSPVVNTATIQLNREIWGETVDYLIIDLSGRIVEQGQLTAVGHSPYPYTVSGELPPGMYTFITKQGALRASGRLLIHKG